MAVRSLAERTADVRRLLATEVDCWVASASADGEAYLLPLSFYWDGTRLALATPGHSRTARNLRRAGHARLALGGTRDVVIVEGPVQELAADADPQLADAHAVAAGFDARAQPGYVLLCVTPDRIQTWRNPAELPERDVIRAGRWRIDEVESVADD
jgi:general stress protein 26